MMPSEESDSGDRWNTPAMTGAYGRATATKAQMTRATERGLEIFGADKTELTLRRDITKISSQSTLNTNHPVLIAERS